MSDFKIEWLHEYLSTPPTVIFDVGAFNGGDALGFKRHFPAAAVYAFEADPRNYERCRTVGAHGVFTVHTAISDFIGETTFYSSGGRSEYEASGSTLAPTDRQKSDFPDMTFTDVGKVPCTTLFAFTQVLGIKHIDFLHMDVQGAESRVLRGMCPLRPTLVFLEKSEGFHYEGASGPDELNALMNSLGYDLVRELQYDNLYLLRRS
jgi:FkbM family methyltransferase